MKKHVKTLGIAIAASMILGCGCSLFDEIEAKSAFQKGTVDPRFVGYIIPEEDYPSDRPDSALVDRLDAVGTFSRGLLSWPSISGPFTYERSDYDYGRWTANGDQIVFHKEDYDDYIKYDLGFADDGSFTINGSDYRYRFLGLQ